MRRRDVSNLVSTAPVVGLVLLVLNHSKMHLHTILVNSEARGLAAALAVFHK